MNTFRRNVKLIDKNNLSIPEYIALYKANPALWGYEQTTIFYDENLGIVNKPHYYQCLVMNGTYSNKMTVVLKCRQCLEGSTSIDLPLNESISIKELYKLYKNEDWLPTILSLDKNNKLVTDEIVDIWKVGTRSVFKLSFDNKSYDSISTLEHKYNTSQGYLELSKLRKGDLVICKQNNQMVYKPVKSIEYYGEEECYDLTTKIHHNYIANGVSTHNSGFSTALTTLFAHDVLFGLIKGILFVSISKFHAEELMDKFYKVLDSIIDPRFKVSYVRKTKTECEFVNGVKARSLSSNPKTMIGFTGSVLWDEAGQFDKQLSEEVAINLFPSITKPGTRMYVVSTPFGKNNVFHKLCTESKELCRNLDLDDVGPKLIKVHWKDVPHVMKEAHNLRAHCPTETAWDMGYCLKFGDGTLDSLFPYEFMRDYAYSNVEEILPFNLEQLVLMDNSKDYLIKESPLYLPTLQYQGF